MPDGAAQPATPFAAGSSPGDLLASMPYALALGITLNEVTPQLVRGSLDWSAERCTASGVMHGGAVMSLADTVGAVCAVLNLPPGAGTATVDSATNFFRAVRDGTLHAAARPVIIPDVATSDLAAPDYSRSAPLSGAVVATEHLLPRATAPHGYSDPAVAGMSATVLPANVGPGYVRGAGSSTAGTRDTTARGARGPPSTLI